jgi:hypothetical protein
MQDAACDFWRMRLLTLGRWVIKVLKRGSILSTLSSDISLSQFGHTHFKSIRTNSTTSFPLTNVYFST